MKKEKIEHKEIILDFYVDPHQGAAALLMNVSPKGYALKKIERKGTIATATYTKIE
jgi:hypothetical protein